MALSGQEDASELKLGEEFEHSPTLFNGEVAMYLREIKKIANHGNDEDLKERVEEQNFLDILAYCERFNNFKTKEIIQDVRKRLSDRNLHQFEIASLANLCPDNEALAKAYIPSLNIPERNIPQYELKDILEELKVAQKFQQ